MSEFIFPVCVYVEDTDCTGVVYHANYLNYFERARSTWADQLGWGLDRFPEMGIQLFVRHVTIDYLKPARLNQKLEVVSRISRIRPASVIYDQHLRLAETPDTILCRAEVKVACVNLSMRPCGLPNELISLLGEGQ